MKIALYVLGEKGYRAIASIPQKYLAIIERIVIGKDNKVKNDFSEDIIKICQEKMISHTFDDVIRVEYEFIITIGWRKLLSIQKKQTLIVLHDSILPRYRGFNPLVTSLINGDSEIGVTAVFGAEAYDTGAIIDVEKISIEYPITIAKAISKISVCYAKLLNRIFKKIEEDSLLSIPQNQRDATYSLWRDNEDYRIDWGWNAEKIKRMVDAVGYPYNGAKTTMNESEYTIVKAITIPDVTIENRDVGKVLFKEEGKLVVVCGQGLLRLDQVLNENGNLETFEHKFRLRFV